MAAPFYSCLVCVANWIKVENAVYFQRYESVPNTCNQRVSVRSQVRNAAGRKTFVRADALEVPLARATAAAICSSVAVVGKLSFASACSRVICTLYIREMNTQADRSRHHKRQPGGGDGWAWAGVALVPRPQLRALLPGTAAREH